MAGVRLTRRQVLKGGAALGAGLALPSWLGSLVERAAAADPAGCGDLSDIEHFVFLMQENRSFDHYFGTLSGVAGFDDPAAPTQTVGGVTSNVFHQYGYQPGVGVTGSGFTEPFRLDPSRGDNQAINDPTHDWGPQHDCWNQGRMDSFVKVHVGSEGPQNGPVVMGYYAREDLPFHHALADAFCVCDHYHCSVLGPTYPNRLYWMSGTLDPSGKGGGPLLETLSPVADTAYYNRFTWTTMPEVLEQAGISWKVYQSPDSIQGIESPLLIDNVLRYFKAYGDPLSPLALKGLTPVYPDSFQLDLDTGQLPQVSWIITQFLECEHPAAAPAWGAVALADVLSRLVAAPDVWEKTALIISYDENGGFFDHLPPPTAPAGTADEYLTVPLASVAKADGISGPIGLGFRVPCLVLSPYARGGLVCSDTLDHTSQLRLLESRFGVGVPNLSAWRRSVTGDFSTAFDFASTPTPAVPALPATTLTDPTVIADLTANGILATAGDGIPYPIPPNSTPHQETTPARRAPSGPVTCTTSGGGGTGGGGGSSGAGGGSTGGGGTAGTAGGGTTASTGSAGSGSTTTTTPAGSGGSTAAGTSSSATSAAGSAAGSSGNTGASGNSGASATPATGSPSLTSADLAGTGIDPRRLVAGAGALATAGGVLAALADAGGPEPPADPNEGGASA